MFTSHELALIGLAIESHTEKLETLGGYEDAVQQYKDLTEKVLEALKEA